MPKSKSPKSKGKSKGGYDIDPSLYPEGTTEIPNPNFSFGDDGFQLQNGDCYVGGFCAHKMGIAWREGDGVYITKDNHSYEGVWENDQLLSSEKSIVKFPDGVEYQGPLSKGKYSGDGTYILDCKLKTTAHFVDNHPVDEVTLHDTQNNILWKGNVEGDTVILRPENHFYRNLPDTLGIGKITSMWPEDDGEPNEPPKELEQLSDTFLKNIVFKKSSKTKRSVQDISQKRYFSLPPSLKCVPKKSPLLKARSGNSASLLKEFLSPEFRNSCPPVHVFTPTADKEKQENISTENKTTND